MNAAQIIEDYQDTPIKEIMKPKAYSGKFKKNRGKSSPNRFRNRRKKELC